MRDVTPQDQHNQRPPPPQDLRIIVQFLVDFVKNPVHKIGALPDWNWTSLFLLQIVLAICSGVLAGIIRWNIYTLFFGLLIMPVVSTLAALLLTLFLYYYFQFFENKNEDFRKLFTLVVLASTPFYVFQILSDFFAPMTLIGFAFTSVLAIVGLCDNFSVTKKRAYQLVGFIFVMTFIAWLMNHSL